MAGTDWASETADTIDRFVTGVRAKTTAPVEQVARFVVFGIVAAFLGIAAVILLVVATVGLFVDITVNTLSGEVWHAYVALGGIFTVAGLLVWTRRNRKTVRV